MSGSLMSAVARWNGPDAAPCSFSAWVSVQRSCGATGAAVAAVVLTSALREQRCDPGAAPLGAPSHSPFVFQQWRCLWTRPFCGILWDPVWSCVIPMETHTAPSPQAPANMDAASVTSAVGFWMDVCYDSFVSYITHTCGHLNNIHYFYTIGMTNIICTAHQIKLTIYQGLDILHIISWYLYLADHYGFKFKSFWFQ